MPQSGTTLRALQATQLPVREYACMQILAIQSTLEEAGAWSAAAVAAADLFAGSERSASVLESSDAAAALTEGLEVRGCSSTPH